MSTLSISQHTRLAVWSLALAGSLTLPAQAQTRQAFTLNEAIDFAVKQNINVKNTQLDATSAEARIKEVKASSLPQVNINGSLVDNLAVQTVFLPAVFNNPKASPDDPPIPAKFGVNYSSTVSGSVNQLLFDAAYKVGLQAASVYRELAQKNIAASKIGVAEQVAKAYYGVLVSEKRIELLDLNVARVDTLLRDTRAMNKQGFVEKIDVDRLEVQSNNLKTERLNVVNLVQLSYYLLKFQMGLGINDEIKLSDQIQDINLDELERSIAVEPTFDYNSRIEFSTLQTQLRLADLDIQNTQKQYLPRLSLAYNYGYNNGRNKIGDIFTTKWFALSTLGLNLSVPIFDGFAKKYRMAQQRVTLQKAQNSGELLKNSIDLGIKQANITLTNNLQSLRTQQRNRDLAQEIARVARVKYKEGVGSNIEVLNAESSVKEAQTNYFSALYNFLLTRVDQDKALGRLYTGQ